MGFNMFDLLDPTEDNENFKTVNINIDNLVPSKDNFYKIDNLEDLKKSIELVGVQQNLVVKELENGKYQIITGHRRYAASKELVEEGKDQFKSLPCLIYQNKNNKDDELIFLFTNSTTRELTDWEKTKQAEKLKEVLANYKGKFQGRKRDIIAQMLNTSPTQVARMDSINNNLIPGLQEEFKEDNLNISAAYEASTLPKEKQKEILEQYNEKGTITIKEVKEKKIEVKQDIPPIEENKIKNILEVDGDSGEILNIPRFKINFEILKELTIDEMANFICSRCNGGNGCAGFCDLAIECKYDNRHEICIKWLSLQAQKK